MMLTSQVTESGQTTLPQEIQDHLQLHPGDQIRYVIQADGSVVIQSVHPAPIQPISTDEVSARLAALKFKLNQQGELTVQDLSGVLHRQGMSPVTIAEMDAAIRQAVVSQYRSTETS